jgi:uncharacterized protein YyaL (SSP411 family)
MASKRMTDDEIAIAISTMIEALQYLMSLVSREKYEPAKEDHLSVDTDALIERFTFLHEEIIAELKNNQLAQTTVVLPRQLIDKLQLVFKELMKWKKK